MRFENGASLIVEVSWLLHHATENDDVQTWLYGTKAGAHWPKCAIYESNNVLKQQTEGSGRFDFALCFEDGSRLLMEVKNVVCADKPGSDQGLSPAKQSKVGAPLVLLSSSA